MTVVLPNSVARRQSGIVMRGSVPWVPIWCANCGKPGGMVPQATATFAFYLCVPCSEKHGNIEGTVMVPDEVFWAKANEIIAAEYGRPLTELEMVKEADDPSSVISKLIRESEDIKLNHQP